MTIVEDTSRDNENIDGANSAPSRRRATKNISRSMNGKQKDQLVSKLEGFFKQARTDRIPFERDWYLNMAMYAGRQNVMWAKSSTAEYARLVEPAMPPWRTRLIVNRIRPAIRKEMAKLNQERPRGYSVPSSSDDSDIAAARAGDSIYEHVSNQDIKLQAVIWKATFWLSLTGNGFIKNCDSNPDAVEESP